MCVWNEYCLVCGGPPSVYFDFEDLRDEKGNPLNPVPNSPNPADYKWLKEFVGVTDKEELIKLGVYTGYGTFDTEANVEGYASFEVGVRMFCEDETDAHGYACHVKCHTLLQKELGYILRYQDVLPLLVDTRAYDQNAFDWSDYGGMEKYHDHVKMTGLIEHELLEDGNLWMLEDPCGNEANAQRILALRRPLLQSGFAVPEGLRSVAEAPAVDAPSVRTDTDDMACTPNSTTFAQVLRLDESNFHVFSC